MSTWVEWSVSKTYLFTDLIVSIDVHLSIVCFVLPARLDYWTKPYESTFNGVLFWTACLPRLRAGPSRQGTLLVHG